eukprot:207297-Chlamydomonas_euryale.AAC.2
MHTLCISSMTRLETLCCICITPGGKGIIPCSRKVFFREGGGGRSGCRKYGRLQGVLYRIVVLSNSSLTATYACKGSSTG